jgi:hypothetical protein
VNKYTGSNLPTNHWLRVSPNPKSAVICTVLLNTECRYCHRLGHTRSACPILAQQKKDDDRRLREKSRQSVAPVASVAPVPSKSPIKSGAFAVLADDSDDDNELISQDKHEVFPHLPSPSASRVSVSLSPGLKSALVKPISYSDILTKPNTTISKTVRIAVQVAPPVEVVAPHQPSTFVPRSVKNTRAWDEDDSDEDDSVIDDDDW